MVGGAAWGRGAVALLGTLVAVWGLPAPLAVATPVGWGESDPTPTSFEPQLRSTLTPTVVHPTLVTVDQPLDVVITGVPAVRVSRNGAPRWCGDGPCPLLQVALGEPIQLSSPEPREVAVDLRAPPAPAALELGAWTRLYPALPPDDPRGPGWSGVFTLDEAADVELAWRAAHEAPDHVGLHQPELVVVGPRGRQNPQEHWWPARAERPSAVWSLDAGTWIVRALPDPGRRHICDHPHSWGPGPAPAWCEPPPDESTRFPIDVRVTPIGPRSSGFHGGRARADVRVLRPGTHTLSVHDPEPIPHPLDTVRGHDLVLRWTPADSPVLAWWSSERTSGQGVGGRRGSWVFPAARFDAFALGVRNAPSPAPPVEVQVFMLPPPRPVGPIHPGQGIVAELSTAPGDPRGAIADLLLDLPHAGVYRVGVHAEPGALAPQLELHPGSWYDTRSSPSRASRELAEVVVEAHQSDHYLIRVIARCDDGSYGSRHDGCPSQPVRVELRPEG